jgi:hypothetical protein
MAQANEKKEVHRSALRCSFGSEHFANVVAHSPAGQALLLFARRTHKNKRRLRHCFGAQQTTYVSAASSDLSVAAK